ncbi:MAG: hypothetical protein M0R47_19225 [Methylobacter sp.]|uniref:hypothetical protein n=1 Tax=Methylobacter sp. TaxID=2051955 RepID=UPI0025D5A439|nr:hypothetical protein [Methylobacter sp.]MCK9622653.1 hypothetical protein [Methylobacter sp.]
MTSSHHQKLTIVYSPWKKLLALLCLALAIFLAWLGLCSNFFILEVILVLLASYAAWNIIGILNTRSVTFYPDKIVKAGYFGETTIPTHALVTDYRKQATYFFHGLDRNIRESIKVSESCLSAELRLWLNNYHRNVYHIGSFPRTPVSPNSVVSIEFGKALSSFRFMAVVTAVYLLLYVIVAAFLNERYWAFNGYAPNLPEVPLRLLFVGIALGGYGLLRRLAAPPPPEPVYTVRLQRAHQRAFRSALVANGVAWLGLPLFLLCGNKLDFYLMLLIGAGFYYDFYPRLSDWERLLKNSLPSTAPAQAIIPRRSLQVSLALLGGLSLASYAGNPADFRIRQNNCQDNNGNATECQSSSNGHGGSGSSYHHNSIRRGGFGSFGGSHFSFGG